jgi:hypothetical protein
MSHEGLHSHRLKNEEEEARFAEAWRRWNRPGLTILAALLDVPLAQREPWRGTEPPMPTKRERTVAATVVQWLGSPVGQSFLEELGYTRVKGAKTLR